jgi:hypothetical protein
VPRGIARTEDLAPEPVVEVVLVHAATTRPWLRQFHSEICAARRRRCFGFGVLAVASRGRRWEPGKRRGRGGNVRGKCRNGELDLDGMETDQTFFNLIRFVIEFH